MAQLSYELQGTAIKRRSPKLAPRTAGQRVMLGDSRQHTTGTRPSSVTHRGQNHTSVCSWMNGMVLSFHGQNIRTSERSGTNTGQIVPSSEKHRHFRNVSHCILSASLTNVAYLITLNGDAHTEYISLRHVQKDDGTALTVKYIMASFYYPLTWILLYGNF